LCDSLAIPIHTIDVGGNNKVVFLPPEAVFTRDPKKVFWVENELTGEQYFFFSKVVMPIEDQMA
jgi:hypothetical protein